MSEIDRGPVVNQSPREANIDGTLHTTRDHAGHDCGCRNVCRTCGSRSHKQGVYGGLVEVCEECAADADCWMPAGHFTFEPGSGTITVAGNAAAEIADLRDRLNHLQAASRPSEPITDKAGPTIQGHIISAVSKLKRELELRLMGGGK